MFLYILSAAFGVILYIALQYILLNRLPAECHMRRTGRLLVGGAAVLLMTVRPVWSMPGAHQVWVIAIAACTIIILVTELTCFWIPDEITLLLVVANGAACHYGLIKPDIWPCLAVISFFILLYVIFPHGMGRGDVKLAAALSLGTVMESAIYMILIAFIFGAVLGAGMWIWRRQTVLPFGPCLLFGWWSTFFDIFWWPSCFSWISI